MGHHFLIYLLIKLFCILKLYNYGGVSEWFKELVLKISDSERGRGFESHPLRHICPDSSVSVEQRTENPRVDGSIPSLGTIYRGL